MGKKVAVIGGGLSGLATLRYLSECPAVSEIVCFERYGYVGGMWVYTERTGTDVDGLPVHSSCYKDLRTNAPKICLSFPDFPYPNPTRPSFIMHNEFSGYLQSFANKLNLKRFIKFNTLVTKVDPLSPGGRDTRWAVTYCSPGKAGPSTTEEFDAVVVCNGHCWLPFEPTIEGREAFKGSVIHVRDFRTTDPFKDKTVLLLGAGISGMDIAPILSPVAKKIIICGAPDAVQFVLPDNACRKILHHLTETSAVFDNGEAEQMDAIILCTGYRYSFPFLTEACGIVLHDEDRRVTPLFRHIVNTTYPSMMFVGLVDFTFTVVCFDRQAEFVAKVIDGTVKLPDKAAMDKDTEQELESRRHCGDFVLEKRQNFHKLSVLAGAYCDTLSALASTPTMPLFQRRLYEYMERELLPIDTLHYKQHDFERSGDTFVQL